jgi:hypothetical protein
MRRCPHRGFCPPASRRPVPPPPGQRAPGGVRMGPPVLDQAPVPGGGVPGVTIRWPQVPGQQPRLCGVRRTVSPVRLGRGAPRAGPRPAAAPGSPRFGGVAAGEQRRQPAPGLNNGRGARARLPRIEAQVSCLLEFWHATRYGRLCPKALRPTQPRSHAARETRIATLAPSSARLPDSHRPRYHLQPTRTTGTYRIPEAETERWN